MGFFDKVKNMFTEEVDDEVKVEQIKQEVRHVPIESPKAKEEIEEEIITRFKPKEVEETKNIFFDDDDFEDLKENNKEKEEEEVVERYERPSLYREKDREMKEEKREEIKFKPTPIISPVYGVLDKNYHKEDIVSRNDSNNENENVEDVIDTIRNKAYGTLEDELENTLFGQNSILFKKEEPEEALDVEDDLLEDLTDDIGKELDELLSKKNKNTKKVEDIEDIDDIEDELDTEELEDDDLLEFIDSTLYSKGEEEND